MVTLAVESTAWAVLAETMGLHVGKGNANPSSSWRLVRTVQVRVVLVGSLLVLDCVKESAALGERGRSHPMILATSQRELGTSLMMALALTTSPPAMPMKFWLLLIDLPRKMPYLHF